MLAKPVNPQRRPWTLGELIILEAITSVGCGYKVSSGILDRDEYETYAMRKALGIANPKPGSCRRQITPAEERKLRRLIAEQRSVDSIAHALTKGSTGIIMRWAAELGLPAPCRVRRHGPQWHAERDAAIVALRKSGLATGEIEKAMECTKGVVAGVLHRARKKEKEANGTIIDHRPGCGSGGVKAVSEGDGGGHQGANP